MTAADMAREAGGAFLLRLEDIDRFRARAEWELLIYEDLEWLGLRWETPVLRQSERLPAYRSALKDLWDRGLLYPCTCHRRDIAEALSAPHIESAPFGPDGPIYPGTCRPGHPPRDPCPVDATLRLDSARAAAVFGPDDILRWSDTGEIRSLRVDAFPQTAGDLVIARRDMGTSYHLSVVVDDAHQAISDVVRGSDLKEATVIHVLLQRLLNLPTPVYHHHRLITDETGKRLAKRTDARAIRTYRENGATPESTRRLLGLNHGSSGQG